ncbi:unnamed protein product (macronuclear) [Paramecium tetraurelia]|uniref:Transmembrane protein n=1 Tax=Paramecium tetraurelia TaxID=5888 RepID=A0D9P1_PARTE|nr:uncharacterized protein GSPATT00014689001 [Paramecium tetraurelia]CAK79758.1 unnamed protein product [Paramecium tetraurelia]|eukprot:XP_001447155.1 hypothetical protein (macronuclear) [Paramecium tetraurelia strain d4-2]
MIVPSIFANFEFLKENVYKNQPYDENTIFQLIHCQLKEKKNMVSFKMQWFISKMKQNQFSQVRNTKDDLIQFKQKTNQYIIMQTRTVQKYSQISKQYTQIMQFMKQINKGQSICLSYNSTIYINRQQVKYLLNQLLGILFLATFY